MTQSLDLQAFLNAVTDAILVEEGDIETIVRRYNVPRRDVDGLLRTIRSLHLLMVGVRPSRRFVQRLRHELVGGRGVDVVESLRYLPPRVQIAAGVVVLAGFMLLSRRRLVAAAAKDDALGDEALSAKY